MDKFYAAQNEIHNSVSADLTTLNAGDISAYRWNAMARFYEKQAFLAKSNPSNPFLAKVTW